MIATLKVLGLRARDAGTVAAAARKVVEYVQGTSPAGEVCAPPGRAAYYTAGPDGPGVQGRARGAAAALVGLSGQVAGRQLERLLSGRHAVTGRRLLPATGSAGRARPPAGRMPAGRGPFTLAEAARAAGVSPGYLRQLVERRPPAAAERAEEPVDLDTLDLQLDDAGTQGHRDRLRAEKDPVTGRWLVSRAELRRFLTEREPPTVVLGFDLTCSAPKSLSLLWAFGDEPLRADVAAALDAGVDATLAYLEQHAAVGTVGGRNRPGLGLAVASYRHEVSRADEAHLHVHNLIVNAVPVPELDDDGEPLLDRRGVARVVWRAVDSEVLHRQVKTAGYLGAAALRRELSLRRGLVWGPVRNGVAELAGFPPGLLEAFSTRHGQIHAEFARLTPAGPAPDPAALAAAQRRTRAAKRVLADGEVHTIQLQRLTAAGWTPEQVRDLAAPGARRPAPPTAAEITGLFDRLAGPYGLTERRPTFGRREAVQAIAAWAVDRLDPPAVAALADRLLADPRMVLLSTSGPRRRSLPDPTYTSTDLLAVEHALIDLYQRARGAGPTPTGDSVVELAITAADGQLRQDTGDPAARLSDEQTALARGVLGSPDRVRLVIGPAGAGKTETLRAVTAALAATGYRVLGTANGGRQSEDLHRRLGLTTQVVAGWLTLLDHTGDPATVWPAGTVLVVDEATQVSTRDAHRLLAYAAATGTVVVAGGDPAQLGSVGAGGWFTRLAGEQAFTLTETRRQQGPGLDAARRALHALRSADPTQATAALDLLAADGRLRVFADRAGLLAAVVGDWYADRRGPGGGGPMMAERGADTELLNTAARALLHADGTLTGPVLRACGRAFQAGDQVITLTQAGHTLVPAGRPARDYVRTGSIGTVTAVHPDRQALTVHFPGKGLVPVDQAYLTRPFPDGRAGGLTHAYAVTAHKAEGATVPTARTLAVDDTSRAGLYVMLSRARHNLTAYLVRRPDLADDPTDETWLPVLTDTRDPVERLADHLAASQPEQLAVDHDPAAAAAHQLRAGHTLAQLTALRRPTPGTGSGVDPGLLRRAELAAETALAATAPHHPPDPLLARVGPRPTGGPDRVVWDAAVTALAAYHARHTPSTPEHDPGPEPDPDDRDAVAARWQQQRDQAEQIVAGWSAALPARQRRRIASTEEAVPRARAVAGIHALLDHGWTPARLADHLTTREQHTVRAGAAVLDHRVQRLLHAESIDPAGYQLPPPRTRRQDWAHTTRLLHAAEVNHLATQPTSRLAAERRHLTAHAPPTEHQPAVAVRLDLLDAALARQLDQAALRLAAQLPDYLTSLLGDRPTHPVAGATWDQHALAVEHYRHHVLGLPHGTPAAEPTALAAHQALGPPPADPADRARHRQLAGLQTTLDLGAQL